LSTRGSQRAADPLLSLLCFTSSEYTTGVHKFSKNVISTPKFYVPDDMQQVSNWGPTNILRQRTKFSLCGDLMPEICALLVTAFYKSMCILLQYYVL